MLQVCKAACLLRICIAFSTPARTGYVRCNAEAEGAPAAGAAAGAGRMTGAADTWGRGSIMPGAGPPTPRAGAPKPCTLQRPP